MKNIKEPKRKVKTIKKTSIYQVEKIVEQYAASVKPNSVECLLVIKHDKKTNDTISMCAGNESYLVEIVKVAMLQNQDVADVLIQATKDFILEKIQADHRALTSKRNAASKPKANGKRKKD